jgi:Uncharacterized protein conserved in bacteria
MMKNGSQPCPCGRMSGKRSLGYASCCGRYHEDFAGSPAPDAESLMRSRYSAFVLEKAEYLLATWDPAFRPQHIDFDADAKWLGLAVREVVDIDADHACVEFVARSRVGGRGVRLHERSRFVRREGRWFYTDGDMLE